jgi:hypothetical protein
MSDRPPIAIVSPRWDAAWFVGPGVASAVVALGIAAMGAPDRPLGLLGWIVLVLVVDVAHVWATLYRTYLDPSARARHRRRLVVLPLLVAWFAFLLHLESPTGFWTAMAYLAIFHFIMQHVGFAAIYGRKGGESAFDRRLAKLAVWAGTAGPVLWWHANLPREFAWFVEGDLFDVVPHALGTIALTLGAIVLGVFVARRVQLRVRGDRNPMVAALVLVPALNWHLGIVVYDDDRIFTLTNVVMHGVPYLALVWIAGGRRQVSRLCARTRLVVGPAALLAVYGLGLLALAIGEEALWDRLVWHDRPGLFGASAPLQHPIATAAAVAILSVPQVTHYLLDRWIWRGGPDNPELATDLGMVAGTHEGARP